jgi:small subunit ribosomal protein S5
VAEGADTDADAPESDGGDAGRRGGRGGFRGGPGGGGGRGGRGDGRGGPGGGGGRGGRDRRGRGGRREEEEGPRYEERTVQVNRVAATVKGGRRMSFSALVVLGDKQGKVGVGFGKAKEVPSAIEKAQKDARKKMVKVCLKGTTIPHEVQGHTGTSKIRLLPASPGTGVIAGASARAVLECVGVQDVLSKQYGNRNPINVVKATLEGLMQLRTKDMVEKLRGVTLP